MQQRSGILVRLSAQDLETARIAATELGVPMDRLFSACALHVAARLKEDPPPWGAAPGRFPAAELLHLSLSPEDAQKIENAAKSVFFVDLGGRRVEMTPPQFVSTATIRLVERHLRAAPGMLRRIAAAGGPLPMPESATDLPVPPARARPSAPRVEPEPPAPRRPASSRSSPAVAAPPKVERPAAARASSPPAVEANPETPVRAPSVSASEAKPEKPARRRREPAAAPASSKHALSKNDLRLFAVIGGVTVLTLVVAIVFFGRGAAPTAEAALAAEVPAPPEATAPEAADEAVAAAPSEPEPQEEPEEEFELPPLPEFSPEEIEQMRAELDALTKKFREVKGSAPQRIDTLLRNIYGRPHVSPDEGVSAKEGPPKLLSLAPYDRRYDAEILMAVAEVESVYPVPPALVKAIIRRESNFNPKVVSTVGAVGLMQVMPFNAGRVGLEERDLWIPEKNILAGVRLLAVLLKFYKGDVISAVVAYNARPRDLFAAVPKNGETPRYVAAVLESYEAFSGEPLRKRLYRNPAAMAKGEGDLLNSRNQNQPGVTQ